MAVLPSSAANAIASMTAGHSSASAFQPQVFPFLVLAWLTGVAFLSRRLFCGFRNAQKLRSVATETITSQWQDRFGQLLTRIGVSGSVQLMLSTAVKIPVVVGWLRPIILLPAWALTGLTVVQIEALLAHELAHIRRHDYIINVLQGIAETILFYHPAVWWVSDRIRLERELCCDDIAVSASGDVLIYVSALAELESRRSRQMTAVMAANGSPLVTRIRRLLDHSEPKVELATASATALVLSTFLLVGICAALASGAPQENPVTGLATQDAPGIRVDAGDARLVQRGSVEYPRPAIAAGIRGTVEMMVEIDANGAVTDVRTLSGPQELRNAALSSALTWRFVAAGFTSSHRIAISFGSPDASLPAYAQSDAERLRERRQELAQNRDAARNAIEGDAAALEFRLSAAKASQTGSPVEGRRLRRIQAQGLSDEFLRDVHSLMPAQIGTVLSRDLIASTESVARQRGVAVRWVPLNEGQADLLIDLQK
jgi:TonB family protein